MVVKKNPTISLVHNAPSISASKNYIQTAALSALTVTPFDIEGTSYSYIPPIVLLSLVSSLNSLMTVFLIFKGFDILQILYSYFVSQLVTLLFYVISAYVYSSIGCWLLGIEHEAKPFGVVASAYSIFPLVVMLCSTNIDILKYIAVFGASMIMPYYINSTYRRYYPMGDDRTKFLYGVYSFLVFYAIISFAVHLNLKILPAVLQKAN